MRRWELRFKAQRKKEETAKFSLSFSLLLLLSYFRPDELVMGEILREFSGLIGGFKANRWTASMIELFFKFCIDLVNRFLANKIIQERK